MRLARFILIAGFVAMPFVAGCSDSSDQDVGQTQTAPASVQQQAALPEDKAIPEVLETFNVGKNVFVRSLAFDPGRQSLWVGTSLGVHEVDLASGDVIDTFTRKHGLANEYIFSILIDSQGYKWFGTNGGGVSRYKDGQWKTYFPMHGLADYWVYAFAEDPDGALWIGTWAGANFFDSKSETFTTYFDELVNEWVYGVDIDSAGRVWLGTEGGVSMYDGSSWSAWTHKDGLGAPNREQLPINTNTGLGTRARHDLGVLSDGRATYNPSYVFSIHVGDDGAVWAGTWGGGVSRFTDGAWRNFTRDDGLAGNIVYSIAQDKDGNLWFGTNQGLSRFDGKTWRSYGRADGLPDENIYAIAALPGGDIWVGSRGGVARIGYR